MNDEEAFLDTIFANLEDMTPRLVYADWLEEHDDAEKAEFIRLYCESRRRPSDSEQDRISRRMDSLIDSNRDIWHEQFGLALSWNQAVTRFRRVLTETITWCDECGGYWWSPELLGPRYRSFFSFDHNESDRPLILQQVVSTRSTFLEQRRKKSSEMEETAMTELPGRLLVFIPDDSLWDGAAQAVSNGFFRDDNMPPWETWIWYVSEEGTSQNRQSAYLISYVPADAVAQVADGILVNPEQCIRWATDVDSTFMRKLRDNLHL